jgi:hypothetical protein
MTPYRKEYNKLYNKIYKLAQKGSDYIFEYFSLIDETISNGLYRVLEDVMITKFRIPIKNFFSIQEFKEFSFEEIRKFTNLNSAEAIQKTLKGKNVYLVGYHLFDQISNHYLGDLREIETIETLGYTNKNLMNVTVDIKAEVGLNSSLVSAIPQFENNPILTIQYHIGNHLAYVNNIYECIQSYTWSSTNKITPTFSAYWQQIQAPSYSVSIFTSSNSLVGKYSTAIDYLRTFTYSYI